jgi:hypothetical protein
MGIFTGACHRQELLEDWQLAVNGRPAFIIEPLK